MSRLVSVVFVAVPLLCALAFADTPIDRRDEAREAYRQTPAGLYGHYCAHCHGPEGEGNGRLWSSELAPRPVNLTELTLDAPEVLASLRDGTASRGKSALCPPWGRTLSSHDLERVSQFVMTLSGRADAESGTTPTPTRAGPPWSLAALLLAQVALLAWLYRRRLAPPAVTDE